MLNKRFEYARKDLWLLRAIALVFSIFLWIAVIGGKKAEINKAVRLDVRLADGLVVANDYPREVVFRIRGPRVFLKELESRELVIPIDLQSSGVGELEVNMTDDLLDLPLGLEVVSVLPKKFKLVLDRVARKRVTVRPVLTEKLPEGFRVTRVLANPSTVEVLGPQKNLRFIHSVPTQQLGLTTSPLRQEFEAKLNLGDFPGVEVTEGVENIYVVADLEGPTSKRRIANIPIALKVGTEKNARRVSVQQLGVRMSPSTVTFIMEGGEEALQRLSPKDLDVWVEIPTVSKGVYRTKILWSLPPSLRVLKRSTDYVELRIR